MVNEYINLVQDYLHRKKEEWKQLQKIKKENHIKEEKLNSLRKEYWIGKKELEV